MNKNPSDISTVVIINKNHQHTQSLQIKTKHINRMRHYAYSVVSVVLVLIGVIIYLRSQNSKQEQEKQQLIAQIVKLKGAIPVVSAESKEVTAQSYIQAIEGKLKTINSYLKRRGLKGFSTKGIGGDANAEGNKLSDKEVYSLYNDYLNRLVGTIAFTPMGYPRVSSFTSF